jgi:branched-chain amino acid transport system ATP-binding protein
MFIWEERRPQIFKPSKFNSKKMTCLLQIEDVKVAYGRRPVLHDVSLSVGKGEVVALIGPNGHGKTTLLRAISGLLPLLSGRILFNNAACNRLRADQIVEQGLAHIPQGDLIFPRMSVRENLLMGSYLANARTTVDRLGSVFDIFPKLSERQNQKAASLSGGERRMLGLGRGLMTGGIMLMIDEPSLGLAPTIIDEIYRVIGSLKEQGRTLLLVEENVSRVMTLADRVYLLDHGQIVWRGVPEELRRSPDLVRTYFG